MFGKLLKHDIKYIARIWWVLAIVEVLMTIVAIITLRTFIELIELIEYDNYVFLAFFCMLAFIASMFAIFFIFFAVSVLPYIRFYKNFFTDEGYLTFTLPASRRDQLLSKTVNALIWQTIGIVMFIISIVAIVLLGTPTLEEMIASGNNVFKEFLSAIYMIFGIDYNGVFGIFYVLETIVILVLLSIYSINLIYLCITLGAVVAKKYKLLAAIGIYYAVNTVLSFVTQFISMFGMAIVIEIVDSFSGSAQKVAIFVVLFIVMAVCALLAYFSYVIVRRLLERKLNLP